MDIEAETGLVVPAAVENSRECKCDTVQSSEDSIRENMTKHAQDIVNCLIPSQLYDLLMKLGLDDMTSDFYKSQIQKAWILFNEVKKQNAYSAFLSSLEEDIEHMGHRYIVSLLRGTQFAEEEEIRLSKEVRKRINDNRNLVVRELQTEVLEPYLCQVKLVTREEIQELHNHQDTKQRRAQTLLLILDTKGPTAHLLFVNECLSKEGCHDDIYGILIGEKESCCAAKGHQISKEYALAERHIQMADALINHCKPDEEEMLIWFKRACILLDDRVRDDRHQLFVERLKEAMASLKTLASKADYGAYVIQNSRIRLAQAHILLFNLSICENKDPGSISRGAIDEARELLKEVQQDNMHYLTQLLWLQTMAAAHQAEVEFNSLEATKYASMATALTQQLQPKHKFQVDSEIEELREKDASTLSIKQESEELLPPCNKRKRVE